MSDVLGVVALNLGGPDSLDDVEPFLRRLFSDPDVIQLGWARFAQPLLARLMARRRAPFSREAYGQIGGRSPIRQESQAQADAVAAALTRRGLAARGYVAMGCWHPLPAECVAALADDGIRRAVVVPLFPQYSRSTTGSVVSALERALASRRDEITLALAHVERYPDAPGYIQALCERICEAEATLPFKERGVAPVLFSAHGLPESYIQRGDPYLDDIRITVAAVTRRLQLGTRAQLCFQSRVGPKKWLGPDTEQALEEVAASGQTSVVVCPVSFTGEHIETLQEIDILYRQRAEARGIRHFARAATVGCHPAFIEALADLGERAVRAQGWT